MTQHRTCASASEPTPLPPGLPLCRAAASARASARACVCLRLPRPTPASACAPLPRRVPRRRLRLRPHRAELGDGFDSAAALARASTSSRASCAGETLFGDFAAPRRLGRAFGSSAPSACAEKDLTSSTSTLPGSAPSSGPTSRSFGAFGLRPNEILLHGDASRSARPRRDRPPPSAPSACGRTRSPSSNDTLRGSAPTPATALAAFLLRRFRLWPERDLLLQQRRFGVGDGNRRRELRPRLPHRARPSACAERQSFFRIESLIVSSHKCRSPARLGGMKDGDDRAPAVAGGEPRGTERR